MKAKAIRILLTALTVGALMSCQDSSQLKEGYGSSRTIEFSNYVGSLTRTSKVAGNSFTAGDAMAVWGDQLTGKDYQEIFNGNQVSYVSGTTWTYANKRLWNIGSDYMFYAVYPYMEDPIYEVSSYEDGRLFKINGYSVPDTYGDQKDIMISERRAISPFNTVDMIFHHMLSRIDFIFRISGDFEMLGIAYVELEKFHIEGIKKTGSYVQTSWSKNDMPVGYWVNGNEILVIPDIEGVTADNKEIRNVLDDYLLVPQDLDDNIKFSAHFKIHYKDSTTCTITKDDIILARLSGKNLDGDSTSIKKWEPNTKYLYQLVFNPGRNEHGGPTSQPNGVISPTGNEPANVDITVDGSGNYWVDEDRDGTRDYPLIWADPDGDGTENLFPDKDGDGKPDNIAGGDLWVDTDGDGKADTEVSRKAGSESWTDIPTYSNIIEFSASAFDWDKDWESAIDIGNSK